MSTVSPSTAKIDLRAYEHNLKIVRRHIPDSCHILAVLKADGYGHGAVPLARRALKAGVYGFAIATVEEGIALRKAGIRAPIVVTVPPVFEAFEEAMLNNLDLMLGDEENLEHSAKIADRLAIRARIHVKVDTGMSRQGVRYTQAPQFIEKVAHKPQIHLVGIATHLAAADDPENPFTDNQLDRFRHVLRDISERNVAYDFAHGANSAAIMHRGYTAAFDMVRPGLMTYGVPPDAACPNKEALMPVLTWESRIVACKIVPKGAAVGYACTYVTAKEQRIGIVPVGYADGYPVALSNRAQVLIRGKRCAVLGRVSMDQIVVDLSSISEAHVGERVMLLGKDGDEEITAMELAARAGTISYEILVGIGKRVERVYVNGDNDGTALSS